MAPVKLVFVMPVWGKDYTRLFLDFSLPSQLAPGNLPSISKESEIGRHRYFIYTTYNDARVIQESSYYTRLKDIIDVEFFMLEELNAPISSIKKINCCFRHVADIAREDEYGIVNLGPDVVYSDGSFKTLMRHSTKGKRLIVWGHLRVNKDSAVEELIKLYGNDGSLSISSRELVKLGMKHLHNVFKSKFWDSDRFTVHPCIILWKVKDEGIIGRFFHPAIGIFRPRDKSIVHRVLIADVNKTIDGSELLEKAFPDHDEVYIVEDSDEFFAIELCSDLHSIHEIPDYYKKVDVMDVAVWASERVNVSPIHFKFFQSKIYIHSKGITPSWKEMERISDGVVESIISTAKFFINSPEIHERIKSEAARYADLYFGIGEALDNMGDIEGAKCAFIKASTFFFHIPIIHSRIGRIYRQMGRYREAIEHFRRAIDMDMDCSDRPQRAIDFYEMGYICFNLQDYNKAQYFLEKVLSIVEEIKDNHAINDEDMKVLSGCYLDAGVKLIKHYILMKDLQSSKNIAYRLLKHEYILMDDAVKRMIKHFVTVLESSLDHVRTWH